MWNRDLPAPGTQNNVDDDTGGGYYCWDRISESDALSPATIRILTFS